MMQALAAVAGYTSTVEAWRRGYADERKREEPDVEPDISDTFHFLYENVQVYLDERGRDYRKLVQKKRVIYRLASTAA
ncbi:MAG TPA: hypothetical protein VF043_10600 [Ktedonobacteraceae bacterium]